MLDGLRGRRLGTRPAGRRGSRSLRGWTALAIALSACGDDDAASGPDRTHERALDAAIELRPAGRNTEPSRRPDGAAADEGTLGDAGGPRESLEAGTRDSGTIDTCAPASAPGEPAPVDIYIMLDRSDSMLEATASGMTKWDAIRDALAVFVQSAGAAGLGVGLQYFPLGTEGVPEHCELDSDCGAKGGPCMRPSLCIPTSAVEFLPCTSNADCPSGSGPCVPFGTCAADETLACVDIGPTGCGADGACMALPGECAAWTSCEPGDYATPAVGVDELPGNADALLESLADVEPIGLTPMPAAVSGALDLAAARAEQYPGHRVVVLLVTDGLPTECLPAVATDVQSAVAHVAELAAAGVDATPSIRSYVLGLFVPEDPAAMIQLDRIADAGGSEHAYAIDLDLTAGQPLLDALASIRRDASACVYAVPTEIGGVGVVPERLSIRFTRNGALLRGLSRVKDVNDCDAVEYGWFYGSPEANRIELCARTCGEIKASSSMAIQLHHPCEP